MKALYYDKEKLILKIENKINLCYNERHLKEIEETGISYFNDCYYIAEERKPLVIKAQEIRNKWIEEVKQKLENLENMNYPKR